MPRIYPAPIEKRPRRTRFASILVGFTVVAAAIAPIASAGLGHP